MMTLNRIKQPFVGKPVACVDFCTIAVFRKIQKGSENWSTLNKIFLMEFSKSRLHGSSHWYRDENAVDKNVRKSLFN